MPTTEHRHHIPGEPNNLSHWSWIEQLERAWLEFLEQHESAIKLSQSKVFSQTENLNVVSMEKLIRTRRRCANFKKRLLRLLPETKRSG